MAPQTSADAQVYDADVIIAGAGISGLSAAHYLSTHGRRVIILESRDRIGGRIHSIPINESKDQYMDLGASFVHGLTDNPLTDLSEKVPFQLHLPKSETPVAAYPPHAHGKHQDPEKSTRMEYLSHIITFQRLHDYTQRGSENGAPGEEESIWSELNRQKAGEGIWKGVTEEERKELLSMSLLCNGWTGASLDQVSLKWWGWEREFRGPDAVVQPAYNRLVHWLQDQSKHSEVRLQHKVDKIELIEEGNAVQVSAIVADDPNRTVTLKAPYFVSSLPLGVMQQTPPTFLPPLPPRRIDALSRLGNGLLNKVILIYETSWWTSPAEQDPKEWIMLEDDPQHHLPPATSSAMTIEDAKNHLKYGRLFGQDYTSINGLPALLFYMGPPLGQTLESLNDADVTTILHQRLVETLSPTHASPPSPPKQTHITRWLSDPHSLGSYSYFPVANDAIGSKPGGPMEMLEAARPLWDERLGFCGEHTEENHFASVHGPLITGIREGKRLESFFREQDRADAEIS